MVPEARDNQLAFRTIRDLRELEALRVIWNSWRGTGDSDLDFFSSMVRSRGSRCRPHVIVLTRNTRPDAIRRPARTQEDSFHMSYFTIYEPEVMFLEFVYGGLRGNASEENCAALVREVMRSLDEGDADQRCGETPDVQSPLYNCVLRLPRFAWRDHSHHLDGRWLMNFPKGLDTFFMNLGRSQRSKLRRRYRNPLNHFAGRLQILCFRSLVDLEPAISDMEAIASKTNKRRVFGGGFFDTPQIREQMVVAAEGAARQSTYYTSKENRPRSGWAPSTTTVCRLTKWATIRFGASFHPGLFFFSISSKTSAMKTSRPLILAGAIFRSSSASAPCGALKDASIFMRPRCMESS